MSAAGKKNCRCSAGAMGKVDVPQHLFENHLFLVDVFGIKADLTDSLVLR